MELALSLQQELGAKLTRHALSAFVEQAQQSNLGANPRASQVEHFTSFVLALDLNSHGDGCLPPNIQVGVIHRLQLLSRSM